MMKQIKTSLRVTVIAIFVFSLGLFSARPALAATTILYVESAGETSGACDSWANACDLQYALTGAAVDSELWVKAGTYKPTTGTDRAISFQLKNGVALYGGFAGTESLRTERDWETNLSILNGDLLGDDSPNFLDDGTSYFNHLDNSYHVVASNGVDGTAILDGVTVKSGYAYSDFGDNYGGGMHNLNSSPTITNVIFTANVSVAGYAGGAGMYNFNSSPNLLHVTFDNNLAVVGYGGGLLNDGASHPTLTDVTFSDNGSAYGGGMANIAGSNPILTDVTINHNRSLEGSGMYNLNSSPILTNVDITDNVPYFSNSNSAGGGMLNDASSPILTDVTFTNNSTTSTTGFSTGSGGGMYNMNGSAPTLTRVTFSGNTASNISGYGSGGGMANDASNPILLDVIFSGNVGPVGGGMRNFNNSSPVLTNVVFDSNTGVMGGGIYNLGGAPVLTNVTFNANTAENGGALFNDFDSTPTLINVTISGNSASEKGGALFNYSSAPVLKNVILWGNSAPSGSEIYNEEDANPDISYSVIPGNYDGLGNLNTDPLLEALADNGGYTKTMALGEGSSAIDTADNATCADDDQRGVTRPQGSGCDIGAFEVQDETTPTATLTATPTTTETPTGTSTPTLTSTSTSTVTPTLTNAPILTVTSTPTAILTATRTPTATVTKPATPTRTKTRTPTVTPTSTLMAQNFNSVATQDGWILELSENSGTGGTFNSNGATFQLGDDVADRQYRAILSFNTTSLPDNAVIQSAILKIKQFGAVVGSDPFSVLGSLWVDIRTGPFGTADLQLADFNSGPTAAKVGSFNTTPALGWYSAWMNNVGRANINKTGLTQLRLYFNLDDNNNNLADLMKFISGDAVADNPVLLITYTLP